ncbi:MAG: hypothetical protein QOF60_3314 [Actinomycetota bacterium]|jgi:hypothetical protein|nr:hypothetical protein [Actinomycetota bacterium]
MRRLRWAAVVAVVAAVGLGATLPAAGQTSDEGPTLPQSYLDGYGWWSKAQQNPTGGKNPDVVPACSGSPVTTTTTLPTNPSTAPMGQCPVGAPADGLYLAYDYEAVTPSAASGAVGNVPPVTTPPTTTIVATPVPLPGAKPPNQVLGPTAYAAVRYAAPDGAETSLTLQILNRPPTTPGGVDPIAGVRVLACHVTTPGWSPNQNDRYDQGPKYDLSSCAVGQLSVDSITFVFPSSMIENGTLDVAIVPSSAPCPDPPSAAPPTTSTTLPAGTSPPKCDHAYQLALAKPSDYSLSLDSVPEDFSTEPDGSLDGDLALEDPLSGLDEDLAALDPESAFASFDIGGFGGGDPYGSVSRPPVARPHIAQPAAAGFPNPFARDASRGERLLAVLLLLLMALAMWWFGGDQIRAPRLLGSLGAGSAAVPPADDGERARGGNGGIGRFVRPRTGKPPRLF